MNHNRKGTHMQKFRKAVAGAITALAAVAAVYVTSGALDANLLQAAISAVVAAAVAAAAVYLVPNDPPNA